MSRKALLDIREVIRYIAVNLREPLVAEGMLEKFRTEILSLQTMPERFGMVSDAHLASMGLRMTSVDNYLIFYVVDREARRVDIPRVLYGKRNWIDILYRENGR